MKTQYYKNHRKIVPLYTYVTGLALVTLSVGSVHNLGHSWEGEAFYSASLLVLVSLILWSLFIYSRRFALKAQDRAIRAEESLRFFVLTGKLPDARLHPKQLIALRFASDEELKSLADKTLREHLSPDSIKREIKNWRADHHRV
jgi:Family of unknown function (DUF6526)